MKSLFEPETHQDILNRIEKLNENTQAQWGKMNVSQMLKHCQLTLEIANGKRQMKATGGFFLKKMVFKAFKPMMYNDKPWKHNLGTAKELIITDSYIFETEKNNIVNLINEFVGKREINNWPVHPLFGHFTTEQRGQMQYKHLDHHLKQFGV
jgi:Protein of unknown function (DUF1569)